MTVKYFKIIIPSLLSIVLLFACNKTGINPTEVAKLDDHIFTHWAHSYEEDSGKEKVYRPISFDFPLSRVRNNFIISKDGGFTRIKLGPADEPVEVKGKWVLSGKNIIHVDFDESDEDNFKFKIISIDKELLKIK